MKSFLSSKKRMLFLLVLIYLLILSNHTKTKVKSNKKTTRQLADLGQQVLSCNSSCKTCETSDSSKCIECAEGYYRDTANVCAICDSTCKTCVNSTKNCITCAANYSKIFNADDNICHTNNSPPEKGYYLDTSANSAYFRIKKYDKDCDVTDAAEVTEALTYVTPIVNECKNGFIALKTKKIIYASDGSGLTYLSIVITADGSDVSLPEVKAFYNDEEKKEFVLAADEYIDKIEVHKNTEWITAVHVKTNKRTQVLGENEDTDTRQELAFYGPIVGIIAKIYVNGFASLAFNFIEECDSKCYTCSENDTKICLNCEINYFFKSDAPGICLQTAPAGYFIQGRFINKCHSSCETCITNESNCLKCASADYYPIGNSFPTKCFTKPTANNKYENIFLDESPGVNYFKNCNPACKYCNSIENSCLECNTGYFNIEKTTLLTPPCYNETNSPTGFYVSKSEGIVKPCDKSCNGCATSSKNCLNCAAGFYNIKDQTGSCFDLAPEGYYLDKKANPRVYIKCDSSCKACSLRPKSCIGCSSEFYPKLGFNSVCYNKNTQLNGFYLKIDSTPIAYYPCPPSCKNCVSTNGACLECASGFFFKEGTVGIERCYNEPPSKNYYFDTTLGLYRTCDSKCAECSEPGENNCSKCIPNFHFVFSSYINGKGKCFDASPGSNYFLDGDVYRQCDSSCNTCVNGTASDCTSCAKDFYSINIETGPPPSKFSCYKEIKDLPTQNYYLSVNDKAFFKCDSSCKTCDNGNSCKECISDNYKISGIIESKCYKIGEQEDKGFYFAESSNLFFPCNPNCKTCIGIEDDKCKSCWNDRKFYFLERKEFFYPEGFDFLTDTYTMPSNLIGQSRAPAVGKCLDVSSAASLSFALNPVDNIFVKCRPNCLTCKESKNENDCFACTSGYRFLPTMINSPFTCYKSAPDNYFIDDTDKLAFGKCDVSCKKCSGKDLEQCHECANGFYKISGNSFPTSCFSSKSGYFVKDDLLVKCLNSCKECGSEAKMCKQCADNYKPKSDESNLAERECFLYTDKLISYYFSDPYFMNCNQYCKYCVGSDEKQCSECTENAYPIDTEQTELQKALDNATPPTYIKCFPNKPDVNYWLDVNAKVYRKCSENCLECTNSSDNSCLKCNKDFFFKKDYNILGDKCYKSDSPPGINYFLSNDLWQECDKTCKTCLTGASDSCTSCADNNYFIDGYDKGPNKCFNINSPPGTNYVLLNNLRYYICTDNCATCFKNTNDACKSCANGFNFKEGYNTINGDTCFSKAPNDFYLAADGLYKTCDNSCNQCVNKSTTCINCASTFYNKLEGTQTSSECYNTKPENNYYLDTDIYKKCSDNCGTCEDFGTDKCNSCTSLFYPKAADMTNTKYECFKSAPDGYYFSESKYNLCTPGCLTCKADGITKCITCDSSKSFFYLENSDYQNGAECFSVLPHENTYLDTKTNTYRFCHTTCKKCLGALETHCTECVALYYLRFDRNISSGDKCYNQIPMSDMFLDTDNFYKKCHESCSQCNKAGETCLKCADKRYFKFGYNTAGDICYSTLPESNYYFDSTQSLYKICSVNCASCDEFGSDKCKSCKDSYFFKEGAAIPSECYNNLQNDNYYLDNTSKTYKLCAPTCGTCDGPQSNRCTGCVSSYFFKAGEAQPNQCYTDLFSQGYYVENKLWNKCTSNCKTCIDGTENGCSACTDNYYYKENFSSSPNKCYLQKPDVNYYLNLTEKLWKNCSPLCNACGEFGVDKCTQCVANSYIREESLNILVFQCFIDKPELNYYLDSTNPNNKLYRKCNSSCRSCDLGPTQCTMCNSGFYFKEGFNTLGDICYNTLPQTNFYLDLTAQLYKPCNTACKTCVGGTAMDCNTCNTGFNMAYFDVTPPMGCYNRNPEDNYFLDNSVSSLPLYKLCHSNCSTCRSFGISKCDTCIKNYYFSFGFVGNANRCFNNKPFSNYYLDLTESVWKPCFYNCATCSSDKSNNCLTCTNTTFFKEGHNTSGDFCFDDFPDFNYFFDDINNIYKKCDISCGTCDGSGPDHCLTCSTGYYQKDGATGAHQKCYLLSVLTSFFLDTSSNTLKPCSSPCLTCAGTESSNCLSCESSYYLIDTYDKATGSICHKNAPSANYYLDMTIKPAFYKLCASECASCSGAGNAKCLTCAANYTFKENYDKVIGDTCFLKTGNVSQFYYDQDANLLKACSDNCQQCSVLGTDKCLECKESFYFEFGVSKPNICYGQALATNYYLDKSNSEAKNWVWKKCDSSCNTCAYGEPCEKCDKGSPKYCLSCPDNSYFRENYLKTGDYCYNESIASNYFLDQSATPKIYKKCANNCAKCLGSSDNQCLSCVTGTHFVEGYDKVNGSECLSGNKEGYFVDVSNPVSDSNSNNLYFKPCFNRCMHCSAKDEGKCTKCYMNFYFMEKYNTAGDFCYSKTDVILSSHHYLDSAANLFKKCDNSCYNCVNFPDNCLECNNDFYSTKDDYINNKSKGFKCFQTLNGFMLKEETLSDNSKVMLFQACNHGCKTCNTQSACLTCLDNTTYFKQDYNTSGDACFSSKPEGYYLDSSVQLYKKCNLSCQSCSGPNSIECISCPVGLYLYIPKASLASGTTIGECVINSPQSDLYKDEAARKLLPCSDKCLTCSGGTEDDCLSCIDKSYFLENYDITGDKCYNSLPDYYYLDETNNKKLYKSCSVGCSKCSGPGDSQCLECRKDFHFKSATPNLTGDFCESDKPIINTQSLLKYIISNNLSDTQCSFNCLSCAAQGENKCFECNKGFYFIENYDSKGDSCYREKPYPSLFFDKDAKLFRYCAESCASCDAYGDKKCLSCKQGFYFKEGFNSKEGDSCLGGQQLYNFYLDQSAGLYKYCGFNSGSQYLQINQSTKNLECKSLSMIDFSVYEKIEIPNIKAANESMKYSVQFWFNLVTYSLNNGQKDSIIEFKSEEIIWDLHMKIRIENANNQIYVGCYPVYDSDNAKESEVIFQKAKVNNAIGSWIKVSCAADQINSVFNLNGSESKFDISEMKNFADLHSVQNTKLIIKPGDEVDSANNKYGFLFLKELKLWTIYSDGNDSQDCK